MRGLVVGKIEGALAGRVNVLGRADRAARRLTRDCRPPCAPSPARPRANKTQITETHLLAKSLL